MKHCDQRVAGLYGAHRNWLQGWLRMRLNCSQQAADLAQDAFIRILLSERRKPVLDQLLEPRGFLVTVAKRVMIDGLRRRALEQAYLQLLAEQPAQYEISPEKRLVLIETLQALEAMLDGLGNRVKEAFLLSQLQGLGYREIAERLGVCVSSVTKYIARATEHCLMFELDQQA